MSAVLTKKAVKVRASSLGDLFDCPARWEAKNILKKFIPSSGNATLGRAVHASTALFDKSNLAGPVLTADDAAGAAVDAIHNPDEEVSWGDDKPADAEKIALALHKKYCEQIAPQQKYSVVEAECDSLHLTDLGIILTGTVDRIRETAQGFSVVDLKTGKATVGADGNIITKGFAFQMGVYELLGAEASGLTMNGPAQVVGMNTAKTDAGQRIATAEIYDSRDVLLGDNYQKGVLEMASEMIHSGSFYGNPKSMMCHQRYCPSFNSCQYRK